MDARRFHLWLRHVFPNSVLVCRGLFREPKELCSRASKSFPGMQRFGCNKTWEPPSPPQIPNSFFLLRSSPRRRGRRREPARTSQRTRKRIGVNLLFLATYTNVCLSEDRTVPASLGTRLRDRRRKRRPYTRAHGPPRLATAITFVPAVRPLPSDRTGA